MSKRNLSVVSKDLPTHRQTIGIGGRAGKFSVRSKAMFTITLLRSVMLVILLQSQQGLLDLFRRFGRAHENQDLLQFARVGQGDNALFDKGQ